MYNPPQRESGEEREIPRGYAGCAFDTAPKCDSQSEEVSASAKDTPVPGLLSSLFPLRGGSLFSGFSWRNLLDGDLLLIAIAILLLSSEEGNDCDEHLWLFLLLLYFMK